MPEFALECHESAPEAEMQEALGWLREFNLQSSPAFRARAEGDVPERPLFVIARDAGGELVGGLVSETAGQWLKIHLMAVHPGQRRRGIGKKLVDEAELSARQRGCTMAFVDTMQYQAPDFYRALGYAEAARFPNWNSDGESKLFFTKALR